MENQNASAEYPHIPAKGSLQTAMPMAALRSLPPLQWRREGGGVSPSTLECRLI